MRDIHPQNHDLATQIARYKAAREIIVADGSAAHLFGMVGRPDQRVAFLMRRSYWSEFPLLHLEHFCGRKPDVVDAVRREWLPVHPNRHKHVSYGEMDLPMVQRGPVKTGDIAPGGMSWPPLSETVAEAAFLHMGLAGEFRPGSG